MSRTLRLSRFGTRVLVMVAVGAAALAGAIAGCGIDDAGSLVFGGDASGDESVSSSLPPEGGSIDSATGDSGVDADGAAPLKCASSQCAAMGGSCDGPTNTCVIKCDDAGLCAGGPKCPPNVPCRVECSADKTCPSVDCTAATACQIDCTGKDTCGTVACAGSNCAVSCANDNSCGEGGVTCAASVCAIGCTGGGKTCTGPVKCTGAACTVDCAKSNSCLGGVNVYAADAQVSCDVDNACLGGVACLAGKNCVIACKGPSCATDKFCCDASVCAIDAGTNGCP